MSDDMRRSGDVLDDTFESDIQSRVSVVGDADRHEENVGITASKLLAIMATQLFRGISLLSMKKLPFTEADLVDTFEWLLFARLWYIAGGRSEVHPRDVEVPALLNPILGAVGRFHNTVTNVRLVPVPAQGRDGAKLLTDGSPDLKSRLSCPAKVKETIAALRVFGVPTSFGLPMAKDVESDELFRLDVVDGVIRGTSPTAPTALNLFTRAMLQFSYLHGLFGNTRVSYMAVSHMEASLENLVLRNIQGPRVNVST